MISLSCCSIPQLKKRKVRLLVHALLFTFERICEISRAPLHQWYSWEEPLLGSELCHLMDAIVLQILSWAKTFWDLENLSVALPYFVASVKFCGHFLTISLLFSLFGGKFYRLILQLSLTVASFCLSVPGFSVCFLNMSVPWDVTLCHVFFYIVYPELYSPMLSPLFIVNDDLNPEL